MHNCRLLIITNKIRLSLDNIYVTNKNNKLCIVNVEMKYTL